MPRVPAGIRGGGGGEDDALPAPLPRRLPSSLARKGETAAGRGEAPPPRAGAEAFLPPDQFLPAVPPRAAHRRPGVRGVQGGEGEEGAKRPSSSCWAAGGGAGLGLPALGPLGCSLAGQGSHPPLKGGGRLGSRALQFSRSPRAKRLGLPAPPLISVLQVQGSLGDVLQFEFAG